MKKIYSSPTIVTTSMRFNYVICGTVLDTTGGGTDSKPGGFGAPRKKPF